MIQNSVLHLPHDQGAVPVAERLRLVDLTFLCDALCHTSGRRFIHSAIHYNVTFRSETSFASSPSNLSQSMAIICLSTSDRKEALAASRGLRMVINPHLWLIILICWSSLLFSANTKHNKCINTTNKFKQIMNLGGLYQSVGLCDRLSLLHRLSVRNRAETFTGRTTHVFTH